MIILYACKYDIATCFFLDIARLGSFFYSFRITAPCDFGRAVV